jgi:hypothetical protein
LHSPALDPTCLRGRNTTSCLSFSLVASDLSGWTRGFRAFHLQRCFPRPIPFLSSITHHHCTFLVNPFPFKRHSLFRVCNPFLRYTPFYSEGKSKKFCQEREQNTKLYLKSTKISSNTTTMRTSTFLSIAASLSSVSGTVYTGFNYGSTFTDGSAKAQSDFQAEFTTAKNLVGTSGAFTSARLYTMIVCPPLCTGS